MVNVFKIFMGFLYAGLERIKKRPNIGDRYILIEDDYGLHSDYFFYLNNCVSEITVYEWRRKNWGSFSCYWAKVDSLLNLSIDYSMRLQRFIKIFLSEHPNIRVENRSNIIRFNRELYTRKILFEKYIDNHVSYVSYWNEKIHSMNKVCVFIFDSCLRDNLTKGKEYLYIEDFDNKDRMEGFEKFIALRNDSGSLNFYPKSLFSFKNEFI